MKKIAFPYLKSIFPGGSVIKNLPANAGDASLTSGLGRSLGEGNSDSLQYSYLDREAWWAGVHGVTKKSDKTQ